MFLQGVPGVWIVVDIKSVSTWSSSVPKSSIGSSWKVEFYVINVRSGRTFGCGVRGVATGNLAFLAELLQTAELFKWKYFLRKSHEFSQDLGI